MPKPHTFPTLYDEVLQLRIGLLKRDGLLTLGEIHSGTVSWSSNGNTTDRIGITVDMLSESPYVELAYSYGGQSRNYRVRLVSVPSNRGAGEIWYFLCPQTGKRCRILYMVGGWFLHREAFNGVYYDSQIQSKNMREYIRLIGPLFKQDKLYDELHKPYFKTHYAGKPTKRYARIKKKLDYKVSDEDYKRVMARIF